MPRVWTVCSGRPARTVQTVEWRTVSHTVLRTFPIVDEEGACDRCRTRGRRSSNVAQLGLVTYGAARELGLSHVGGRIGGSRRSATTGFAGACSSVRAVAPIVRAAQCSPRCSPAGEASVRLARDAPLGSWASAASRRRVALEITTMPRAPAAASPACAAIAAGCSIDPTTSTSLRGIPVSTPERTIVDLVRPLRSDRCSAGWSTTHCGGGSTTLGAARRAVDAARTGARVAVRRRCATCSLGATRGVAQRESMLEDFVLDALRRFGLPLPVPQHPVRGGGPEAADRPLLSVGRGSRSRRKGSSTHGRRAALRRRRACAATSSSSPASASSSSRRRSPTGRSRAQVAEALGLPRPRGAASAAAPSLEWLDRRDRLGTS